MDQPLKANREDGSYIFICYAHADKDAVYPILTWLQNQGFSIWYDAGISPGASWSDELAEAIEGASLFLYLVTPNSANSEHCVSEVNYALDNEVPVLVAHLFETELPKGLKMRLSGKQAVMAYECSDADFRARLLEGVGRNFIPELVMPAQKGARSRTRVVVSSLVLIALLGGLVLFDTTRNWLTSTATRLVLDVSFLLAPYLAEGLEQRTGIAVLPFINMSSNQENDYFSDGISEEILNALVNTNRLPVIARTSSFRFKGGNHDVIDIGRSLGVAYVLEGSVRRSVNQVRITAQLINATNGVHLWSETYEMELADIFALQNEIAGQIVSQIEPVVELPTAAGRTTKGTRNLDAYDQYLKASQLADTGNPHDLLKAIGLFHQVVLMDDQFSEAWVALGIAYMRIQFAPNEMLSPADVNPIAMHAFRTALVLDPENGLAMGSLGFLLAINDYQWLEGKRLLERALELSPQHPIVLAGYGQFLAVTRHQDAVTYIEKAYRLNPYDNQIVLIRAERLYRQGRRMDALATFQTLLIRGPHRYDTNYMSAFLNAILGRVELAREHLEKVKAIAGNDLIAVKALEFEILRLSGDEMQIEENRRALFELGKTSFVPGIRSYVSSPAELTVALNRMLRHRWIGLVEFATGTKPDDLELADWDHIRTIMRIDELEIGEELFSGERTSLGRLRRDR